MSKILHEDRNGCALHGAIKVLDAIKGVVPIVHASSGCSLNARFSANAFNGAVGRNFRGAQETSATTLYDKHVVFGGTSRLREQIKNTVKVLNGDLYVVATGCVPEVVGDDVPAMVKEAQEQRFPVLGISAPGFKGNAYVGYEIAVKAIFEGLATLFDVSGEVKEDRVNLLGLVPDQDPFWEGDLIELESVLATIGLEANRLLGVGQDLKNWKNAFRARLNLVVSPWGLEAARFLSEKYGTPYLDLGWLPVGSKDVGLLLERLGGELSLDEELVESAQRRFDRRTRYFLQKTTAAWLQHDFQKDLAIVANSAHAVGLARFLAGTFGQQLSLVVITDQPPESFHAALVAAIHQQSPATEVLFSASRNEISQRLLAAAPGLILASHLEAADASALGVALLEVATPLRQSLVLNRSYAGFNGALALVEDFSTQVLSGKADAEAHPSASRKVVTPLQWAARQARSGSADGPLAPAIEQALQAS